MSQVAVVIDGKTYRMACDPGQEDHLVSLAAKLDTYVTHLKTSFGEIGDLRLTVMAAIMIMDELNEAQEKLKTIEGELAGARHARDEALVKADSADDVLTARIADLAEKMETIAGKLT